ncbi:MAG: DUF2088 domain-containing protein [Spirochaetales bacterium]|nr:DUF2088 domain-containing protein [Spirochaetales bacterium]
MEIMKRLVDEVLKRFNPSLRRVLLLPPDITRYHSGADTLTNMLYHIMCTDCQIDVIPTLGQHVPHTPDENQWMFGDISKKCFHIHNRKASCTQLGDISKEFVWYVTNGRADWSIPIEINRAVIEKNYALIVNIDQIVPAEVLRFATPITIKIILSDWAVNLPSALHSSWLPHMGSKIISGYGQLKGNFMIH